MRKYIWCWNTNLLEIVFVSYYMNKQSLMVNMLCSSSKFNAVVQNLPPLRSDRILSAETLKKFQLWGLNHFLLARGTSEKLPICPSIHPSNLSQPNICRNRIETWLRPTLQTRKKRKRQRDSKTKVARGSKPWWKHLCNSGCPSTGSPHPRRREESPVRLGCLPWGRH